MSTPAETPLRVARLRACRLACLVALMAGTGAAPLAGGQNPKQSGAKSSTRATAQAIRIELKPKTTVTYTVGNKPDLVLRLVDPKGAPFTAPKDFTIVVEALTAEGQVVHKETITVNKGTSAEDFDLDIDKLTLAGAIRVRATNPELLEGGTVLFGKPRPKPAPKRPLTSERGLATPAPWSPHWPRAPFAHLADDVLPARLERQAAAGCGGDILVSPRRPLMADARDFAELTLVVDPVSTETRFYLTTTLGRLAPNPIVIQAGPEPVGSTQLTSDAVGEATVTCVRAVPPVSAADTAPVTVRFKQPVTSFELSVTPPRIPWIDRAGIAITLHREGGATIATDEKRRISLSREAGSGEIQPEVVDIEEGEFEGRATFTPYEKGPVRISAAMSGFVRQHVDLEVVALPYLMFLLPTFGGLCGGLLASVRQRRHDGDAAEASTSGSPPAAGRDAGEPAGQAAGPQALPLSPPPTPPTAVERQRDDRGWTGLYGPLVRVLVGILTGTVLHWALVFEVLPILPRRVVMSLFSWFVLPLIGGWLGTEVFRVLLNQLGIGTRAAA